MIDGYCIGCRYLASLEGGHLYTCDYILDTGHRRGCETGINCIRRKELPANVSRQELVREQNTAASFEQRQMLQRRLDAENEKRHFETLKRWTKLSDEQLMRVARKHRYYQEHKGRAAELKRIHREERRNAKKAERRTTAEI